MRSGRPGCWPAAGAGARRTSRWRRAGRARRAAGREPAFPARGRRRRAARAGGRRHGGVRAHGVVAEVAFAERAAGGPTGYAMLVAAWTSGMLAGTLVSGRLPSHRLAVITLAGTIAMGAGSNAGGHRRPTCGGRRPPHAFGGLANGMEVVATRASSQPPGAGAGRRAGVRGILRGAVRRGLGRDGHHAAACWARSARAWCSCWPGMGGLATGAVGWFTYARRHRHGPPSGPSQPARPPSPR